MSYLRENVGSNKMIEDYIILNYHAVTGTESLSTYVDPIYSIDLQSFRTHLQLFEKLNLNVVTLDQVMELNNPNKLTVCLTFDDGHPTDHAVVAPLLNEYNYKASFFPTLKNFQNQDVRWERYQELAASGHLIGAHGVTHNYLSTMTAEDQYHELKHSKTLIEEKLTGSVNYFALPGGKYTQNTVDLAKEVGYKAILTTEFGFVKKNDFPFTMKRWSVKKSTSLELLESVLIQDFYSIKKLHLQKSIKHSVSRLLGNNLTDKLNYMIHR